jgi:hypothetical protein
MKYLNSLRNYFHKELHKLELSIGKEKIIRDSSPSAMESHHDTTRNQTEKLIQALESQYKQLQKLVNSIPNQPSHNKSKFLLWKIADLEIASNKLTVLLVPEGLGGKKIENFQSVSENTPLGQVIKGKNEGYKFIINESEGKIIKIF